MAGSAPDTLRNPRWNEVKKYCEDRLAGYQKELLTCEIPLVERIRGRIQALQALLDLSKTPGDGE